MNEIGISGGSERDQQEPRSLLDETLIRESVRHQIVSPPIEGGIQVKVVFLTDDYAIHLLRVRGASSLAAGLRGKIDGNPLLVAVDRWMSRVKSPFIHALKQNAKIVLEVCKGNFSVLSMAKLARTLRAHGLSDAISDLIDPYIYLKNLHVKRRFFGVVTLPVCFDHVIVKERNDRFLDREMEHLAKDQQYDVIKSLISQALQLDEQIWTRHIFNTDLVFPANTTVRGERVALRDIGALTNDRDVAEKFLRDDAASHIETAAKRLAEIVPQALVEFYIDLAQQTYALTNFNKYWPKVGVSR
ncbi:MAG: hypothetical protein GXP10_09235 [Gammaproteobacteria bacterium]|nr:hypothetical protein [Gammaproteobacteria bacterium]